MHLRPRPRHAAANPHAPIPNANVPNHSEVNPTGGSPIAAAPSAGLKPTEASPRAIRIQNLAAMAMPAAQALNPAARAIIRKPTAAHVMVIATASKTSAAPAMATGVVTMALVKVAAHPFVAIKCSAETMTVAKPSMAAPITVKAHHP